MIDKVYIILATTFQGIVVESVWSTFELAQSAIHWHSSVSRKPIGHFSIVVRNLDKTIKGD